MKSRRILALILSLIMVCSLFVGCGGSDKSTKETSKSEEKASTSTEAAPEKSDSGDQKPVGQEVNTIVDGKFVSKSYMLTTLTNTDVQISETKEMLSLCTPSENAMAFVNIFPGLQNFEVTAQYIHDNVPTFFQNGVAMDVVDGYLFGARAKLIPYTCTFGDIPLQGIYAVTIVNQTMYTLTYLYSVNASESEIALMNSIVTSMQILKPQVVDQTTKKAAYVDPYPEVTVNYYPQIYFPDLYESYDDYEYYDISAWDYLPYDCYDWCDIDYSAYDESFFTPDYDYYEDETQYWDWGWDEEESWEFYEEYEEVYTYESYDEYEDYSVDFEYDDTSWEETEETYYEEDYFESYDEY